MQGSLIHPFRPFHLQFSTCLSFPLLLHFVWYRMYRAVPYKPNAFQDNNNQSPWTQNLWSIPSYTLQNYLTPFALSPPPRSVLSTSPHNPLGLVFTPLVRIPHPTPSTEAPVIIQPEVCVRRHRGSLFLSSSTWVSWPSSIPRLFHKGSALSRSCGSKTSEHRSICLSPSIISVTITTVTTTHLSSADPEGIC